MAQGDIGLKTLLIYLLLVGLFVIALINGALILASNNSPNQTIANDPAISDYAQSLNASLEDAYGDVNASQTALETSPVQLTGFAIIVDAIAGLWKTLKNVPLTLYNLSAQFISSKLLGDSQFAVVAGVLGAIVLLVIIFAVWYWLNTGDNK